MKHLQRKENSQDQTKIFLSASSVIKVQLVYIFNKLKSTLAAHKTCQYSKKKGDTYY